MVIYYISALKGEGGYMSVKAIKLSYWCIMSDASTRLSYHIEKSLADLIQISLVCLGKIAEFESYLPFAVPYLGPVRYFYQHTSELISTQI